MHGATAEGSRPKDDVGRDRFRLAVIAEIHSLISGWVSDECATVVRVTRGEAVAALVDGTGTSGGTALRVPDVVVGQRSSESPSGLDPDHSREPLLLVVDVLRPSRRIADLVTGSMRFAAMGVPEYWAADPVDCTIDVYRLVDGVYEPQDPDRSGRLASSILPGLTFHPIAVLAAATTDDITGLDADAG